MAKSANQSAFPLDAEVARAYSEWHIYLVFHLRELEKVSAVAPTSPAPAREIPAVTSHSSESELILETVG